MSLSIAMLHYAAPPTVGGVETTIAAHARVMSAAGHQVRIIAGRAGPLPSVEVLVEPDLSSRGDEIEIVAKELAAGIVSDLFETLTARIADRLSQALAGVDIAIVHNILTLHRNLPFTAALHRLHTAGIAPRLLAWCHNVAWTDPLLTPELHDGYPWKLLRQPWPDVRYVVVSNDQRGAVARLLGVPTDWITVVTPGVDLAAFLKLEPETMALVERFDLLRADPLLLLPARVTRHKNIEQAVAIVGALRQQRARPRLIVTGPPGPPGPATTAYLGYLKTLQRETGAGDGVLFLHEIIRNAQGEPQPISDSLLSDLYRLADGLLFPSRYEAFGIPILEAGLAGIPIFCSDIAPFRETAGETAVRFHPEAAPEDVATRMITALGSDQRIALRRRVRLDYTWDAIYRRSIVPLLQ
ncbi:MAG: glycosyltransferase [Roseiflexaceae bacterium]|nr:glycosyltransferase [Roseiflexaceae bacterium]